jgi:hypothetical protein
MKVIVETHMRAARNISAISSMGKAFVSLRDMDITIGSTSTIKSVMSGG